MSTSETIEKNNVKNDVPKPMVLVKQEFFEQLVNIINSSNLPMFVVEYIMKDVYEATKSAAQREYESNKESYENAITSVDIGADTD